MATVNKTRIKPPQNNNRFLVTVEWSDGDEMKYHTHVLKQHSDDDLLSWLENHKLGFCVAINKIEWVDDEGVRYAVNIQK